MTKKKHEELVGEIWEVLERRLKVPNDIRYRVAQELVTLILSAARDGKAEILCPECNEPIKVLKCEGCHLENVDGYIRH